MARGTTGAPRNASGQDTRNSRAPGFGDPGAEQDQTRSGGRSSPVLWLLPIISAGVALTVAQAVIYLLTQHANLTVNGQSEGILVVLVTALTLDIGRHVWWPSALARPGQRQQSAPANPEIMPVTDGP